MPASAKPRSQYIYVPCYPRTLLALIYSQPSSLPLSVLNAAAVMHGAACIMRVPCTRPQPSVANSCLPPASSSNTQNFYSTKPAAARAAPRRAFADGVERLRHSASYKLYWTDLFHTLLNMPRARFIGLFFAISFLNYFAFALFYAASGDSCIPGVKGMGNAIWFSVQTAASIGAAAYFKSCVGQRLLGLGCSAAG